MAGQRGPGSGATSGSAGDADWIRSLVDRLAATSRVSDRPGDVSLAELRRLRQHLAIIVLRIPRLARADESVAGHRLSRTTRPIQFGEPVAVQIAKFVKHVINDAEWNPETTSLERYLADLAAVVLDEGSDLYLEEDANNWKLTFGRRSTDEDEEVTYTVVSFIPLKGLWLTGFRPERGRSYVSERGSANLGRWISVMRGSA